MTSAVDSLPALATRSDVAYLDFVGGFREYILGKGAGFEDRLNQALIDGGEGRSTPWSDVEQIRAWVQGQPLGQLRDRLARTQQEMKWHALSHSFVAQRTQLREELTRWESRGPGRLLLDPSLVPAVWSPATSRQMCSPPEIPAGSCDSSMNRPLSGFF